MIYYHNDFFSIPLFRERDFDDILSDVARDLSSDSQIEKLGKALGVELSDIQRCLRTNQKGPVVTDRGTLAMLRDWRQNVTEEKERDILRTALIEAKLTRIAGKYFPEGVYGDDHLSKIYKIKIASKLSYYIATLVPWIWIITHHTYVIYPFRKTLLKDIFLSLPVHLVVGVKICLHFLIVDELFY